MRVTVTATMESRIHNAQAKYAAQVPQGGTQTNIHI